MRRHERIRRTGLTQPRGDGLRRGQPLRGHFQTNHLPTEKASLQQEHSSYQTAAARSGFIQQAGLRTHERKV